MDTPTPHMDSIPRRGPFHHYLVDDIFDEGRKLERELILANQKLEAIRKLIGDKVALLSTHHLKEILGPSAAQGDPLKHQDSITL